MLYHVVRRTKGGAFVAVISGCGRHRGTQDSSASRRTAQRWARELRTSDPHHTYTVETIH
jgi:hypothetical protein